MVLRFMANNGSEGLSPDEWLPDRISVGFLTIFFTPELRDAPVDEAGAREQRCRLLPTRLAVYFTLALWPFRGRNCGYGQMMTKLADGLYNQRRGADLLSGQLDLDGWVDAGDGQAGINPGNPFRSVFPVTFCRCPNQRGARGNRLQGKGLPERPGDCGGDVARVTRSISARYLHGSRGSEQHARQATRAWPSAHDRRYTVIEDH